MLNVNQIINEVETAASELAYEMYDEYFKNGFVYDTKASKRFSEMKKDGIKDIPGSYADELYNDPNFLEDMIGDKIYDAGSTKDERIAILNAIKNKRNFEGWKIAMNNLENSSW